jgi:GNAT superfamily N-acetyltransferase
MALRIIEETVADLEAYETVPMTLLVRSIYRVLPGATGWDLVEEPVETPWLKDYEQFDEDRPTNLAKQYDFSLRGIFAAYEDGVRIGGAIVAPGEAGWYGRENAVLVDIRVDASRRRAGVGRALIASVVDWARLRGLENLMIETQNVNVPGCRFYQAMGAVLSNAERGAYQNLPDEVRLTWRLALKIRKLKIT